jgi:hypothetical protein
MPKLKPILEAMRGKPYREIADQPQHSDAAWR